MRSDPATPYDVPELLTSDQVAQLLGVSRRRVNALAQDHADFPDAAIEIGGRRAWREDDIERFASARRSPGAPLGSRNNPNGRRGKR